ncbi:hypothetical protein QUC31_011739 [Theobroma cacao]
MKENCCCYYTFLVNINEELSLTMENPSTSYNPSSKSRRLRTLIRSYYVEALNPSISGVLLHCDKCRTKAMRIAAVADGVSLVERARKDKRSGNLKGEIPNVHEASTQAARRMDKSLSHDEMTT